MSLLWFIVLPIGVWVWLQAQRIDALARRVAELELQLFHVRAATPAAPTETPAPASAPQPVEGEEEPLLLTEVVPDDVLVLDTPLPEASNDADIPAPVEAPAPAAEKPRMHSPLLLDESAAVPDATPPREEPERTAPAPTARKPRPRLDQWLAEKGLAWLAGITLTLAAIYFVGEAMKSTWFTAPLRVGSAFALGLAFLGASEWTRRAGLAKPPGHPLLSALLAGAGMVVLYATAWIALGFGLIGWPGAAAMLTLCALALIGLSFLHGEALGVLAVAMALLAPALTSAPLWPSWLLTLYIGAVSGGGFALSALRRWAWVAIAALAGLYFWFFASLGLDDIRRALALVSFASLGAVALTLRPPVKDETKAPVTWSNVHGLGPSIAVAISSALLIWAWIVVAPAPAGQIAGPALIGIFHVALAAYAVRARAAIPAALAIAIGALVIGFMAYLRARFFYPPLGNDFYPTALFGAFTVVVSALGAHPHHRGRKTAAGAGGIGAAIVTLLAAVSRGDGWHSIAAWAPLFIGGALLFVAAWRSEATSPNRKADAAIDLWAGAGAALMLVGVESALPAEARAAGHATATLLFSIGLAWRGWRIFGWAALASATIALGHALSPTLIGETLGGEVPIWAGLLIVFGAAVLLFSASTVVRRSKENVSIAEALSTASVIAGLVGFFMGLRWIAAGGVGVAIGPFTETSLHVIALMAAGLVVLPRIHEAPGPIGAWRGHVLLCLGLLFALALPGLSINPWWGTASRAVVSGMPLLNSLTLAFLAPAILAFIAANRLYGRQLVFARIYAAAGGALTLMWLVMEIRHAFHNAEMAAPSIGLFESACYALAVLAAALAVTVAARVRAARNPHRPFTQDLMRVMRGVAWAAMVFAVLIMLVVRHPIWGAQDTTTSNAFSTMLAVLAQYGALLLALALGRALSLTKGPDHTRFVAASTAALFAWSAGHCVIRWLHHRGYMDDGAAPMALEGLLHSVWPLALVIGAAQLTRLAPGRDTVHSYLYDLQSIWSAAIWPALAFAGFGLWLMFTPWWGLVPAEVANAAAIAGTLTLMLFAAALSYVSPDVPNVRFLRWLVPAAQVFCAAHLFVAATLFVRWLYHGAIMNAAPAGELELWAYSAVWAVFGGIALGLGMMRNDPVLRWIGLAVLAVTTVKVFVVDTRLSDFARAASLAALGIVAAVMTWIMRRNRPPPSPGDLVTVTPSARRERRRVRRRTSP